VFVISILLYLGFTSFYLLLLFIVVYPVFFPKHLTL